MSDQKKIIFVSPSLSSFVKLDIKLLKERYEVNVIEDDWNKRSRIAFVFIKQLLQILKTVNSAAAILVSFGGYWSFWPVICGKLFRKPVYIIIHGTDACDFPEINYGNLRIAPLRLATYLSYKWATKLFPVSESLIETNNLYFDPARPKRLGVKAEFPSIKTPYEVIHNGLDIDFWKTDLTHEKDPAMFVTVATEKQFVRKGVDLMIAVADSLPSANFYVIGSIRPEDTKIPDNVVFTGRLPQAELIAYFHKAQYYLQLSVFEGFGLSLCEAMLCECIPFGSSVNVIPEIIGNPAHILHKRDAGELHSLLQSVMQLDRKTKDELGQMSKQRIIEKFPISRRKELLYKEIG